MLKFRFYFLGIIFISLFISSCEKDEEKVNEAQVLVEYLESTSSPLQMDYLNEALPSIKSATEIYEANLTGKAYIIDIRSSADFNLGHIKNAHNVALADLFTHCESVENLDSYDIVAIACYTGQTAGYAASLLRLKGYSNVYTLKWGMCSWNAEFATKWYNAVANGNAYATQFTSDPTPKGPKGDLPLLSTGAANGAAILESRLNSVLTEWGDATITNATVFADKDSYHIVNYWPEGHYTTPGHIPGAMQYTPKASLKLSADLKTLPTDKIIVTYCYTGQTSAFLTAYLRLMGYDAKTLLYGTNGMIFDKMKEAGITSVFSDTQIINKEYE